MGNGQPAPVIIFVCVSDQQMEFINIGVIFINNIWEINSQTKEEVKYE